MHVFEALSQNPIGLTEKKWMAGDVATEGWEQIPAAPPTSILLYYAKISQL